MTNQDVIGLVVSVVFLLFTVWAGIKTADSIGNKRKYWTLFAMFITIWVAYAAYIWS